MKYLVAPAVEQAGKGPLDFCWTRPGEPITLGSKCDRERPGGSCGCRRAVSGIRSRKATTVAVVADIPDTLQELAEADTEGFWHEPPTPERVAVMMEAVVAVARVAAKQPIGTRLGFRFSGFSGSKCSIFLAGPGGKWGV